MSDWNNRDGWTVEPWALVLVVGLVLLAVFS